MIIPLSMTLMGRILQSLNTKTQAHHPTHEHPRNQFTLGLTHQINRCVERRPLDLAEGEHLQPTMFYCNGFFEEESNRLNSSGQVGESEHPRFRGPPGGCPTTKPTGGFVVGGTSVDSDER